MAVIVRTCCCGCELRTGVIIIALFYMAALSYTIYGNVSSIKLLRSFDKNDVKAANIPDKVKENYKGIINFSIAAAVINGLYLVLSVLLLLGAIIKNRTVCLLWFGFTILVMLIGVAYLIFLVSIWSAYWLSMWIILAQNCLTIYFLIVVYSYSELLKEEENGIPQPTGGPTQGYVVTVPMSNQPPAYSKH